MLGRYSTSGLFCADFTLFKSDFEKVASGTDALKSELAQYHNSDHIVLFNTGFWALVSAIRSKLTNSNRLKVILPSLTYRRLADAVHWAGGTPVFADIDPNTLALSIDEIKKGVDLHSDIGLVLLVQPIVGSVNPSIYVNACADLNVPLIIDSVESVHDTVGGQRTGSFNVNEVFSVHASKFINGFEGGYVAASCGAEEQKLKQMLNLGGPFTLQMNPYHAQIAYTNLLAINEFVAHNRNIYNVYREQLSKRQNLPLQLLSFDDKQQCGYKNIVAISTLDNTKGLLTFLNNKGYGARPHYQPALHEKTYQYQTHIIGKLTKTETIGPKLINLPCGWRFREQDVGLVLDQIEEYYDQ